MLDSCRSTGSRSPPRPAPADALAPGLRRRTWSCARRCTRGSGAGPEPEARPGRRPTAAGGRRRSSCPTCSTARSSTTASTTSRPSRSATSAYRVDLPPAEPAPFFPRCINAPMLMAPGQLRRRLFGHALAGQTFPERFQPRSRSTSTAIDTALYRPRRDVPRRSPAGRSRRGRRSSRSSPGGWSRCGASTSSWRSPAGSPAQRPRRAVRRSPAPRRSITAGTRSTPARRASSSGCWTGPKHDLSRFLFLGQVDAGAAGGVSG